MVVPYFTILRCGLKHIALSKARLCTVDCLPAAKPFSRFWVLKKNRKSTELAS